LQPSFLKKQKFSEEFHKWFASPNTQKADWLKVFVSVRKCQEVQAPEAEEGEIVADPVVKIYSQPVKDMTLTLRQVLEQTLICEYPTLDVQFW